MKGSWQTVFTILFICSFSLGIFGQKKASLFRDTLDNGLDLSRWLQSAYGFVPLVSLITEPALGFGGAGGLIFVHRDPNALAGQVAGPPSLSAAGGMYTANGSWAVGGSHVGFWKQDRIRYQGGGGYGSINLTYYRPEAMIGPSEVGFNIKGGGLKQQLLFRFGESRFFGGGEYTFFSTKVGFDGVDRPIEIPGRDLDARLAGLGAVLSFDNRENIFHPTRGYGPW